MLRPSGIALAKTFLARPVPGALAWALGRLGAELSVPALVLVVEIQAGDSSVALGETLGALAFTMLG